MGGSSGRPRFDKMGVCAMLRYICSDPFLFTLAWTSPPPVLSRAFNFAIKCGGSKGILGHQKTGVITGVINPGPGAERERITKGAERI